MDSWISGKVDKGTAGEKGAHTHSPTIIMSRVIWRTILVSVHVIITFESQWRGVIEQVLHTSLPRALDRTTGSESMPVTGYIWYFVEGCGRNQFNNIILPRNFGSWYIISVLPVIQFFRSKQRTATFCQVQDNSLKQFAYAETKSSAT